MEENESKIELSESVEDKSGVIEEPETTLVAEDDKNSEKEIDDSLMNWYIIHTYSGYELKVKDALKDAFARANYENNVSDIIVPMEDVVEIRKGMKKITSRKFFPGYILIKMDMNENLWYIVKNTQKVTGFLGGNNPVPLKEDEVKRLIEQMDGSGSKPKHKVAFEEGESVRVIEGPFSNFSGVVDEVNEDRGKIKVMVSIFGRATPVELEFPQVEKV